VLGTEAKRYFHRSDTPNNGVVLKKDLTTETGTVEYASRQKVWEEPLHEIYENEVTNTSTPTRLEANVLNEVFKNVNRRTCAVVKIQPTQEVCRYTVVQYNGEKPTRKLSIPELQPLLRPNAVPKEGHQLKRSRDEPMPTIAAQPCAAEVGTTVTFEMKSYLAAQATDQAQGETGCNKPD
jgi:hypothetical protein